MNGREVVGNEDYVVKEEIWKIFIKKGSISSFQLNFIVVFL